MYRRTERKEARRGRGSGTLVKKGGLNAIAATAEAPRAHTRPDAEALLRVVLFRPYLRGRGPAFVLTMWATDRTDYRGQTVIGYRLTSTWGGRYSSTPPRVLFAAEDFSGSPMNADDSDETVKNLMGFLTLRLGDTDEEYFENYTEAQREYCDAHAEDLSCEVDARFGSHEFYAPEGSLT